jgi:glyoxylase-like metal-dependent hydrolase (beta-lactamase superfamily II)
MRVRLTMSAMESGSGACYAWRLLRAGEFRLDGGSMFGLIPRSVWSRSVPTDELGRITVQHNILLLERHGSAPEPGAPKLVILETGSGDKLDPKFKSLFAMSDRSILDALHEVDCKPEDVGLATCTHLHFDHAGGLTRKPRSGETGSAFGSVATFPNARIVVQARELADARAGRSVMTKTYFKENYEPLADHLQIVDSPRPFAAGVIPNRDQHPLTPVSLRETVVAPGISVFLCPGHTWGQQAMKFTDVKGNTVVFVPDVMPTAAHVGQTYSLAYDVEPYTTLLSKTWLLAEAAAHNWLLVLDHEVQTPAVRVRPDGKGWYTLQPE